MGATSVQWTSNEHKTVIQPHIKELFCNCNLFKTNFIFQLVAENKNNQHSNELN